MASLFTEEDFEDNAFADASIQVLKVAMREDAWHTDGGASLLHVGCTIFGTRELQVEVSGREDSFKLTQSPGSFYIGNMCALRHNVVHGAHAPGSCGAGLPSEQFQIAVMLRSDVFRECRACKISATPGPTELYDLVNLETARMIAERPFYLPDLPAILAETVPEGSLLSGKHRRGGRSWSNETLQFTPPGICTCCESTHCTLDLRTILGHGAPIGLSSHANDSLFHFHQRLHLMGSTVVEGLQRKQ